MSEVETLRRELDGLDKQRCEAEARIRDIRLRRADRGRGRGDRGGPSRDENFRRREDNDSNAKRRRAGDDDEAQERQRPKPRIMSTAVAPGATRGQAREPERLGKRTERQDDEPIAEKPEANGAYKNPETVNRNRRMFGALMGHLGSASKRLKQDTPLLQKQEQVQKVAQHKADEEAVRLKELQRRIYQEEQEKELRARDEVLAQQRKTEVRLLQAAFKAHTAPMLQFLMTKTEPKLLFLPGLQNETTTELLAAQSAEIEQKIQQREQQDAQKLEEIERIVPEGIERRRLRREERQARYEQGDQSKDQQADDDQDGNPAEAPESDEDIDALERELDTEDIGIETLDGRTAAPKVVERSQNNDNGDGEDAEHTDKAEEPVEPEGTEQFEEQPARRRSSRKRA